ncbi:DUF6962 family protein [Actinomadura sp. 3N407]|uniref:DUF6962 family protein n=1 Tax=Actinomadura sp. 3N407 TaxID=3457423 RepID=UPI003FCE3816
MEATTNLILALVTFACAVALLRVRGVLRAWHMTFWFAGGSALAGAVYHGLFHTDAAWIVVGVLVVLAISYLLIGSAQEILSPRGVRIVVAVRAVGVAAYAVAIVLGRTGLVALVVAESATMACVLGLWIYAAAIRHHMAKGMILALLAHGLAGVAFVLPDSVTARTGLNPTSLSHLALIPGILVLYAAIVHGTGTRQGDRLARVQRSSGRGPPMP